MKLRRILPLALMLLVLVLKLPVALDNFRAQGTVQESSQRELVNSPERVSYPPAGPALTLFWSTRCAPCKLEMERLRNSVESGRIPADRIFLISLSDSDKKIAKFLAATPYPFVFLRARPVDRGIPVAATPTLVLWDQGRVISVSTGPSLLAIWRGEWMF